MTPESKAAEDPAPQELREEIEETREELGETVAAVAQKTDVKAQARSFAEENRRPLTIAGAGLGLLLLWRVVRR